MPTQATRRSGLSPRERVLRSIEGKSIDRVPFTFRADKDLTEKLRQHAGADDLEAYFEADTTRVGVGCSPDLLPDLSGMTCVADVNAATWPDHRAVDVDRIAASCSKARATGRAVCSGVWASIFTNSRRVMGEERYLVDMCLNPELIAAIVDRLTDCFLDINQHVFCACARDIDIFYFGSDFGTQASLFISPEHYREFFKPNMRRLVEQAKGFGLKVMFHTCGAVAPIIPDLIDIGVDVLDPVQVSAYGMKPAQLAAAFRGKIAFHGGISTQTTLPFGTADDIRNEVFETLRTLGPSGYVAAPDQEMMPDIPVANVVTMVKAVRDFAVES